ncbi:ABC transporter ATP-binding protein [Mycolicibacillus parakoreensis]|uniref:ABC transporter ATP-binding protein/permease n=1 Tax=Mycolicibacillus parakoreensis TaxID=1069221 RepID=A0ABY3U8B1_9MYCO|nr:ABC transporter ATP-binding protein [Mycolicibacillus parakoreensis]MCV7314967.1 ABC transporter ATP-binding protein [Mycolicibacillus parakoreensis]ULN53664.1 ABC transporter ATP-binding protein/permease [Mycolicibacillus parakoreensis]HLR99161.1 ABC transporter ATP-binding protein [Mycolicibacillus parakoreensis]
MLLALLRCYLRPYRAPVAVLLAVQAVSSLASLALPTINARIIDDGIAVGDTAVIVRFGAVMLAVAALQVLCALAAVYLGARSATGFGRDLRAAVFDRVIGFSEPETLRFGTPSLLTRSTNDVRQIQVLVQLIATVLIAAPIMSVGGIVMAVRLDAKLSWLLVVSVPLLAVANYAIAARMLPIVRRLQRLIDGVNRVLRDQLSGVRVVRALAREDAERARFAEANRALTATTVAAGNWQALLLPATTLIINGSSVALIWFGALRIDSAQMQIGALVAFLSYFTQILMAVVMATMVVMVLPRATVCAERIRAVLDTRTAITSPARPRAPQVAPAPQAGVVEFRDVDFRYPGAERPVLDQVCWTARPGTSTAIVGGTGSGKSTLVSLICRLYDVTGGSVRVGGVDVREQDLERLWAMIGLVPQRGYLFSGTVADNLRYGARPGQQVSDTQMWEALTVAAADDFVADHPDGLAMPVAQGGINLSGGQRQRLAIARAVVADPAIYLFDDAFSALDVHTDARVRRSVAQVAASATTVIVSQRIATISHADQIVVLDGGRVAGVGTHAALLDTCRSYTELVDSQTLPSEARR